jgi:hypothetical protein
MKIELKPCPFCGQKAYCEVGEYYADEPELLAGCENNGCVVHMLDLMPIETWNNRPVEDRLIATIKALEATTPPEVTE